MSLFEKNLILVSNYITVYWLNHDFFQLPS